MEEKSILMCVRLLRLIAVMMTTTGFTQQAYGMTGQGKGDMVDDHKVYTFAFGSSNPPFEVVDPASQSLMGISPDVVREVCERMEKNCQLVVLDDYNSCWDEGSTFSRGLNSHWYDACVGMFKTKERSLVYSFRGEYAQEPAAYLYSRSRSFMNTVQDAVTGNSVYKVGFIQGSWLSSNCVKRFLGWNLEADKIEVFATQALLQRALENGGVDVALLQESKITDSTRIKRLGTVEENVQCAMAGRGVTMRKDKAHMFEWFDEGLEELKESGKYTQICNRARVSYGEPRCFTV